ncbi:phosphoadenosine phosphosulfate reductase [Methanococcus vannielii SB]|jgi:3'-phosphoadenosine 5'-phosphosulfate sulfotransferase (PAPS reductase)/FAD synthetase|uniref:Phosphoadenosine phosphosulfate reductase n=1 Tax=Methanococcus vannielii (strain ATCC 35089 / DSM 1224 / JCM 13029 / OCM 148 / SB) TaxID=406327 RepID=A6UQW2_METVS|nr:phosphoadenosine phosphosulfate reductase family protein [Methanococcus vannielii]ABR54884.1 phosphoadenosine phosphosulfate reductase [Methanococcus vannielii SB]
MFDEDTKFASNYELKVLNELTGQNFQKDDVILLEKLSGLDYRKRVYIGNDQIGTLEFDLHDLEWKFVPSPYFYTIAEPKIALKYTKKRLKGKYIKEELLENPEEYNALLKNDFEYVGITIGDFLGVGVRKDDRIKLKDLSRKKELEIEKMPEFLEKNKERMNEMVENSINILEETIEKYKKKGYVINVSFSGGKDSSVCTLLSKEVMPEMDVVFIDTGLEYPETIQYVKDFSKKYDIEIDTVDGDNFWDNLEKEGIPTKDNRWCNSACKLMPLKRYLKKKYGNRKVLTIDGSRKYESFARANLDYERKSGFIDFQTNVFPILDWNSLDIWTYIYSNDILYNPMYDKGFERIGCYLCPSALNSEFLRVEELYPDHFERWVKYLKKYYPKEEVLRGFWRWKELPPKMVELEDELGYNGERKKKIKRITQL